MTSASDLLSPGVAYTRGGVAGTYSNVFTDGTCTDFKNAVVDPKQIPQLKKGWAPANIAIVSNGLCGSTCAAFVRYVIFLYSWSLNSWNPPLFNIYSVLRDQFQVKTFTYGGSSGKSYTPTSFEGGVVAHYSELLSNTKMTDKPQPGGPVELTLPVDASIPIWEGYSPSSQYPNVPAEWVVDRADDQLAGIQDTMDTVAIWKATAVAAKFSSGARMVGSISKGYDMAFSFVVLVLVVILST